MLISQYEPQYNVQLLDMLCCTFILSTLRASPTTLSPFLTSSSAMAAPIPALAPVTTATRPDQRSIAD